MRYRMIANEAVRPTIVIQSMIESDERLSTGETTIYGESRFVNGIDLFKKIKKAINSEDKILRFEKIGEEYHIEWLKRDGEMYTVQRDVFEFKEPADKAFVNIIDADVEVFKEAMIEYGEKTIATLKKKLPSNDIFRKCIDFLSLSSDMLAQEDESIEDVTKMFQFISERKELFCHAVEGYSFNSRMNIWTSKMMNGFRKLCLPLAVLSLISMPAVGILSSAFCFMYFTVLHKIIRNISIPQIKKIKSNRLEDFLSQMKEKVDYNLLTSLQKSESPNIGMSFTDFVNRDISLFENVDYAQIYLGALKELDSHYSENKVAALCDGVPLYKGKYVMMLLAFEQQIYLKDERRGMMSGKPNVSMTNLYELIEFLGYSKEEARADEFIRNVYSTMRGIYEHAYYGCECELIALIKVAIYYIEKYGLTKDLPKGSDEDLSKMNASIDAIFYDAEVKVNQAVAFDKSVDEAIKREEQASLEGIKHGGKAIELKEKQN